MAEEEKERGPGREHFSVNKINKQANGGLHIDFTAIYPNPNGEEGFVEENDKKTSQRVPVDVFLVKINSLETFVAKVANYADVKNLLGSEKFKASKDQTKFINSLYNEFIRRITINGIQIWTNGTIVTGCQINYSLEGLNSQSMDHKTYKIDLSEDINVHGFEDDLRKVCSEIISFSYDYIFNRIGGQLKIVKT